MKYIVDISSVKLETERLFLRPFEVKDLEKVEITNFLCLTQNILVNEELIFKVEANYEKNRPNQ